MNPRTGTSPALPIALARHLRLALLLFAGFALPACTEEVMPDEPGVDDGANRGALVARSVDGTQRETLRLGTGAVLEIGRGALSSAVRISMERPSDARARALMERLDSGEQAASAPYVLKPHGQTFVRPVKLTLPIVQEHRGREIAAAWLANEDDTHWERIRADRTGRGQATISLDHFSVVMLVVARGDEPEPDGGTPDAMAPDAADGSLEDGASANDGGGSPTTDTGSCAPGTVDYAGLVVDGTVPSQPIPGVTVEVLDNETGLPLAPPVRAISSTDGRITLTVDRCKPFAVKARGNANYVDTYTYHVRPASSGQPDALIRMSGNNVAAVLPVIAQYAVLQDRAPVAGAVYWKTQDMAFYDVVGCAHIEAASGAVPDDWALRYFAAAVPSSLADWPLSRGTRRNDGRFFLGNAAPGKHTLVARVNGAKIGQTDLVIFPRSMGSTQVNGGPEHLFMAGIYIDAPEGSVNPTPANCQL